MEFNDGVSLVRAIEKTIGNNQSTDQWSNNQLKALKKVV